MECNEGRMIMGAFEDWKCFNAQCDAQFDTQFRTHMKQPIPDVLLQVGLLLPQPRAAEPEPESPSVFVHIESIPDPMDDAEINKLLKSDKDD